MSSVFPFFFFLNGHLVIESRSRAKHRKLMRACILRVILLELCIDIPQYLGMCIFLSFIFCIQKNYLFVL